MSEERSLARIQADFERLQEDYNATLEALQEQMDQVEALTAKVGELEPEAKKSADLLGQLRGLKHKGAFQAIAEKLGVKKEALEDFWTLGGWKAESDEPDAKAMEEHFAKLLKDRVYLKEQPGSEGGEKAKKLPADENGSRGPSERKGEGKIKATKEQLNDPDWMSKMMGEIAKDPSALELV